MALYFPPSAQEMDSNGDPLSGAKLFFYEVNSSTKKTTYTDKALTIAHTNPVVADSSGRWDAIYLDGAYKVILTASTDTDPPTSAIRTWNNISTGTDTALFGETEDITTTTAIDSTYANKHLRCTGTLNLNLLDLATAGEGFVFSFINDGTGLVTIDPNASEPINDTTSWVIPPGASGVCIAGTTEWSANCSFGIPQTIAAADLLVLDANKQLVATKTLGGNLTLSGDNTFTGKVITPDDGELTIATGAVTVTGVYHTVDTESDAASDDLDTINGGADGQILVLQTENSSRDVTITQAGNIVTPDGASFTLSTANQAAKLIYSGALSKWVVLSRENQTASETVSGLVEKATQAEMETPTADKYPDAVLMNFHPGVAKAWALFTTVTTTAIIVSHNITSVTDNGTGDTTLTIATDFSSANYCYVCSSGTGNGVVDGDGQAQTAGALRIVHEGVTNGSPFDGIVNVAMFGDQA